MHMGRSYVLVNAEIYIVDGLETDHVESVLEHTT